MIGKATAAFKKRQLNWRPLTLMHSWVSPQQEIEEPEGPLRRGPEHGRVVRDDAERGTRIHQKSAASLLVHKVKKAARGDGAYTPLAA
jgi:hypothetical protein